MEEREVVITGMGVVSSIGKDINEFNEALFNQHSGLTEVDNEFLPVMGLIKEFDYTKAKVLNNVPKELKEKVIRTIRRMPLSVQTTVIATIQAWNQAELFDIPSQEISIVTAGSNLSQGYMFENFSKYNITPMYISPLYAIQHFDTNYNGVISDILDIHGEGMTIGGASASGNSALLQGFRLIKYGLTNVCICIAPMYDFSPVELSAFSNISAFGDYRSFKNVVEACRPFDKEHKGFIPGQASACIILESKKYAEMRKKEILAEIVGGAIALDGNRLSNASEEGEFRAMKKALEVSKVDVSEIDYLNAHGTSTPSGDEVEANAIIKLLGDQKSKVWVNSTKSLTGHCLYSAGMVEAIACVCQMRNNYVHGTKNLDNPITNELLFARDTIEKQNIRYSLSNSFGFGGINTAIVLKNTN